MFSAARLRGNVIHRKVPTMLASFSRFPISRDLIIAFTIVIIIVNFSHCTYIQDASVDEVTVHMGKPDEKERNSIQCDEQLPWVKHWSYNMDKMAIPVLMDFTF